MIINMNHFIKEGISLQRMKFLLASFYNVSTNASA